MKSNSTLPAKLIFGQHLKTGLLTGLLLIFLYLQGCAQAPGSADQSHDEAPGMEDRPYSFPYEPDKDMMLLGGESVQILGDTLGIKMYIGTLHPGDSVGLHSHPNHTVYVLQGGTLAVYLNGTDKQIMELPEGIGFVAPPLSDAAVNIGNTTIKLLTHDIYR